MSQTRMKQFNFTEAQLAKLCTMQHELNTYIHPNWQYQGFDWETAVNDECLEILEHLGWKWWKDKTYQQGVTEANKAQIKLELIDLLHFVVSSRLENAPDGENGFLEMGINVAFDPNGYRFYESVKTLQQDALHYGISTDTVQFLSRLMHLVDMTEQEILETYTQKYVLNKFRQDHGYKDGSYVKVWELLADVGKLTDGVAETYVAKHYEDNEVLAFVVAAYKEAGRDTTDESLLYSKLESLYSGRLNK